MTFLNTIPLRVFFASTLIFLAACAGSEDSESNPYGLRAELQGDPPDRTWVEPEFAEMTTLSGGSDYTLFNPAVVWILEDTNVYVWDAGDNRLKKFTPKGKYVTSYGKGDGDGPGAIRIYSYVRLWRDSLYVLGLKNRRGSFFDKDGTFGRSEQYRRPIKGVVWTDKKTRYELYRGPGTSPSLDITTSSGQQTNISDLLARGVSSIVFAGKLQPGQEQAVHVPYYYPLLLAFSPDDTVATAYPTPDYGDVPIPEPQTEGNASQKMIRPPSQNVHYHSTVSDGVLSVQLPSPADSLKFDLYETREMQYMHSVRLPLEFSSAKYAYGAGLLTIERDTTVELYRVDDL